MHGVPLNRLREEIFGADAVLYITLERSGAAYTVLISDAAVTARACLIDANNGDLLWSGEATASSAEYDNNNNLSLAGLLVKAIVKQVVSTSVDQGHDNSKITSDCLLSPRKEGLRYGSRLSMYKKDL